MKPGKSGQKRLYSWLALACFAMLCCFALDAAHAYDFYEPDLEDGATVQDICPDPGYGFIRRFVPCIKDTIVYATNTFFMPFSLLFADAIFGACTIAVIMWAIKMLAGTDTAPLRDMFTTVLKVSFVGIFSVGFGTDTLDITHTHNGDFGVVLDIMEELVGKTSSFLIAAGGDGLNEGGLGSDCPDYIALETSNPLATPASIATNLIWDDIDCSLDELLGGITNMGTEKNGIVGFLTACLTSNALGVSIGILGIWMIWKLFLAIFRSVYTFLAAYMGISFIIIISPMMIPTLLFRPTKPYFDRWLKLLISFILQPIMVMAYLSMLLAAFDTVFISGDNSIFNSIDGGAPPIDSQGDRMGIGEYLDSGPFYTTEFNDSTAITVNNKELKAAGYLPQNAEMGGAEGKVANKIMDYVAQQQDGFLDTINSGARKFFPVTMPMETVDWDALAKDNGYNCTNPGNDPEHPTCYNTTLNYIITVLVSFGMAFFTIWIFYDLLDTLPMIGATMANYGKPGESVAAQLGNMKGGGIGLPKFGSLGGG